MSGLRPTENDNGNIRNSLDIRTWMIVAFGVILILFSIIIATYNQEMTRNKYLGITETFIEISRNAILVTGIENISIELKDWRDYFGERLRSIVSNHKYLKNIESYQLRQIRMNIAEILYNNSGIRDEGSFLQYLQKIENEFMTSAHRVDINYEAKYEKIDGGRLLVTEEVNYSCRKYAGEIQEKCSWVPDRESEIENVRSIEIYAQFPHFHQDKGKRVILLSTPDPNTEGSDPEPEDLNVISKRGKEIIILKELKI